MSPLAGLFDQFDGPSAGFFCYQPIGPLKAALPFLRTKMYFLYFGLYFPYCTLAVFSASTSSPDPTFLPFLSFEGFFIHTDCYLHICLLVHLVFHCFPAPLTSLTIGLWNNVLLHPLPRPLELPTAVKRVRRLA